MSQDETTQGKPVEELTVEEIMSLPVVEIIKLLRASGWRFTKKQIAAANVCLKRDGSPYRYDALFGLYEE